MNLRGLLGAIVTLRDCGTPSTDKALITSMGIFPSDPLPNENTTLWVAYDLKSPLTGGTATYSITLNGIPFPSSSDPLCTQTSCPKDIGSYNETSSSLFPSDIAGKLVTKIQWMTEANERIWCLESTFKI